VSAPPPHQTPTQPPAKPASAAPGKPPSKRASDTGQSAYLARKGVAAYGLRFAANGDLLVPMQDAAGTLHNLQRIAPTPPSNGGTDKLFLKGGRKSGLWHWCGNPQGAEVLLLAEGYATAASLHQATGYPTACAFDAGNLPHVAKALHQAHPAALLVICGDNDSATEARTGTNPGQQKATAAARAVQGLAVFPQDLPEGKSDFNDLHQAAGLEAVRTTVQAAIDAQRAAPAAPAATTPTTKAKAAPRAAAAPAGAAGTAPQGMAYEPFTVDDSGVWFNGADQDGKRKPPEWVCSPLTVEALTRDQDGTGWGYLLAFADPLGHPRTWAMPARMLSADGGEYRATLLNMGLRIASTGRARNHLTHYIQSRTPSEFASCTDRIGWHNRAFVLPKETIGDTGERIVFQSDNAVENTFRTKGSASQWRDRVGALFVGNSRLAFAVACAFAGPLLRPAGMESGGFHYRGDSSSGKTTALKLAASVYGGANYLQRWRATDNALEATAAQHSDCLLILDELAQIDPKTAGECAYMLANEQGKARATRTGTPRPRQAWRLLFLSAGELGLADHMAEGQKRTRTGQEVRMADIPADAGANLGAFEALHGHPGGAALAKHATGQAQAVYGAVGTTWLTWLTDNAETLKTRIRAGADALAEAMVPPNASGQVERVGARFALVGAAGELATLAGLTGWPTGESERAATACFDAWLAARGGSGNGEIVAMLRQVRRFLETHGEGRFTQWHRAADDHSPKTLNRAGLRRMVSADGKPIKSNAEHQREYGERMPADLGEGVSFEYFVLPECFKGEICQGFDAQAVARVLLEHGCLVPEGKHQTVKTRLPGIGPSRCYRITPKIFELDI
jgi:putative DNA primase/helicase